MLETIAPFFQLAWSPGPFELGVILIVALLLFGGRLPSMMRNMGRGVTEFKKGIKDTSQDIQNSIEKKRKRIVNVCAERTIRFLLERRSEENENFWKDMKTIAKS